MILLLSILLAASPKDAPKMAVMDIVVYGGIPKDTSIALSEAVVGEIRKRRAKTQVISAEEIRGLLSTLAARQKFGCDSDRDMACMTEIGGALGASHMVNGSLSKLGSTYVFSLRLVDVNAARVLNSVSVSLKTSHDDDLLGAVPNLVARLFPEIQLGQQLVIEPTPEVEIADHHSHVPAILLGAGAVIAGGFAVFGLTQVIAYNNDVGDINANRGTLNYQSVQNAKSSANLWQILGIGLTVLGVAGATGAVLTW